MSGHRYHPRIRACYLELRIGTHLDCILRTRTGQDVMRKEAKQVFGMMAVDDEIRMRAAHVSKRSGENDWGARSHFSNCGKNIRTIFKKGGMNENRIHVGKTP